VEPEIAQTDAVIQRLGQQLCRRAGKQDCPPWRRIRGAPPGSRRAEVVLVALLAHTVCRPILTRIARWVGTARRGAPAGRQARLLSLGRRGEGGTEGIATVLKTYPPVASMAPRRISSWRRSAGAMAAGSLSHKRVEPSTSVNSSVTVPVGIGRVRLTQRRIRRQSRWARTRADPRPRRRLQWHRPRVGQRLGTGGRGFRNWFARSPRRLELVGGVGGLAIITVASPWLSAGARTEVAGVRARPSRCGPASARLL